MANSRRRRDQRQRQRHRAAEAARRNEIVKTVVQRLPAELHAEIHRRLDFLRRLAFASICGASGHMLRQEAPWVVFPGLTEEKAIVVSMAEGPTASMRTSDLALLHRVVIGSTDGWLVTADKRACLRMANPATGAQAALPAIDTIPFLHATGGGSWFTLDLEPFLQVRFGGPPPPEDKDWGPYTPRSSTLTAAQMRQSFYRKVVLSASPQPGSYAAMLITDRHVGAPAFATAEDKVWRMARSPAGVEDAIHHDGRFYSVTYAGDVEAWERDAGTGEFTSKVVAPRLAGADDKLLRRKYLAVSPEGKLMAVCKHHELGQYGHQKTILRVFFTVHVLDQRTGGGRRRTSATPLLFVGVDSSSNREHPRVAAGCIHFTNDEVGDACLRHALGSNNYQRSHGEPDDAELRHTAVYILKTGRTKRLLQHIPGEGDNPRWPPPVWFTPSFL
ncbi:LOW QUALITY PROTEIN: hypothetical protein SETIT_7G019000v2 [Setaria italica]|uniref:KIB1-4 beta-propeller domain-containing protein n=1 Tax=Setaria italica TaxID=4555 RepID=A0A368RR73_SETIT|nr:LOW QUALITY PROTEIN: hypothetical protein SETIT_7G019000v2 [Setaria italica]